MKPKAMEDIPENVPAAQAAAQQAPARNPDLLWGAKAPVLLVDDDPIQLQIAAATLGGHEYDVTTAVDGWEGIRILKEQDFELIVVDLDMPRLDGFGFIEEARKLPKCQYTPIIVVSGRQDVVSIDRAFDCGADSFMDKPVNWNLFGRHVRYVLRNSDTSANLRRLVHEAQTDKAVGAHLFESVVNRAREWMDKVGEANGRIRDVIMGREQPESLPKALAELDRLSGQAGKALEQRLFDQQVMAGTAKPVWQEVDQADLLHEAMEAMAGTAKRANVKLDLLPADMFAKTIFVSCDPKLLRASLMKLMENAIAVTPAGGTITCQAADGAVGEFEFQITDAGPGFTNKQLEEVLQPAHFRSTLRGGVGLLVADRIAKLHDARIEYSAPKGGGACATLALPKSRITREMGNSDRMAG